MNNDSYLTIFISIIIILIVINLIPKTQIHLKNKPVILHFAVLIFIVFLFYTKYEKSAFMTSLLYLIIYVQSYKIKEYFASSQNLPDFSLTRTINPTDIISESILTNNNLPSQITSWFTGDSFDSSTKDINWRDLASSNHIYFTTTSNVKLNNSTAPSGPRKWVSGDTTAQLTIPFSTSTSTTNSITFIHLSRYTPKSINRGKLWTTENGTWVSGYNDNKITATNMDGTELLIIGGDKNGDIMNIRGSNWNLFIDQMDNDKKIRTVLVNGNDYIFQNSMQSIPDKIGLNISSGNKSDWDCAEIMTYPRILGINELQQITQYFNKKYSMKYPEKIPSNKCPEKTEASKCPDKTEVNKYNIYNHYTFSSTPDNDWQAPPKIGGTTQSGNKLLGITDSEYECVSLCDENTTSCAAFSYHMEKGACYSVDEKNILNHTTPNKAVLSGTNRVREDIAQKAKEEADRKAREAAEAAAAKAAAAAAKQALIASNSALPWFTRQYYVNVPHKPELNISVGDFCIECWYYENSATGNNTIVDKGDYSFLFQVRPNGQSSIGFYNRSTGWWYSSGSIPSKQWVHLAINYSQWNRTMSFYMNGDFVSSNTFGSNFTATNGTMNIGRQSPDSCSCNLLNNAAIFDLRLWNWFRSQYQIQVNMRTKISPTSTGLIANYMMTYRSDLVIYDETNRNHGSLAGSYNPYYVYRIISLPYLHEDIPYDSQKRCPRNYNAPTADGTNQCYAGWSWTNSEWDSLINCTTSNGTWIPKDYRYNAYTCEMNNLLPKPEPSDVGCSIM